jgi:hypothetical protein
LTAALADEDIAGQNASGVQHEQLEQLELLQRQRHRDASHVGLVTSGVDLDVAHLQHVRQLDPVVAEMQQLRDQMFQNRELPDAQRRAQWQEFRLQAQIPMSSLFRLQAQARHPFQVRPE